MEYLVRDGWNDTGLQGPLGITRPHTSNEYELKIVWEGGSVSYPWMMRRKITDRFIVIKELTDEEAMQHLFSWTLRDGIDYAKY